MAGPTGFEPAISSVTGRRDNHFTTGPYSVKTNLNLIILPNKRKYFNL